MKQKDSIEWNTLSIYKDPYICIKLYLEKDSRLYIKSNFYKDSNKPIMFKQGKDSIIRNILIIGKDSNQYKYVICAYRFIIYKYSLKYRDSNN
jgi:hypothetical protein